MCLTPALLLNFGFGPCTFFRLTLVPTLYKTFGISPFVKYLLKKKTKTNGVPRGTLKDKKNQLFNYYFILYFLT